MQEIRVLYQIKSLEKLMIRLFQKDMENQLLLEEFPITPTQMQIMEYMIEHKDKTIYQKDLEEVLNLRRATVSGVLQTMEKNGLLERTVYGNDARTKRITLKPKATKVFSLCEQSVVEMEKLITKDISLEELETFSKVMHQMKENLKKSIV